jgi:hypothetical protein
VADWCNARLVVAGRSAEVERFRRIAGVPVARPDVGRSNWQANAQKSRVFRGDMMASGWPMFSERATQVRRDFSEKKYFFQACDEKGQEHFQNLSLSYPNLWFVYVYGWDGWNEYSYGSYLISRGHIRGYQVPVGLIEKALAKHRVDDNPNDEWPYQPEIDAEMELMDLAEAHWKKKLLSR